MIDVIYLKNISVKNIIKNLTMSISSKKLITIFGKSGIGKSTLLKVISNNVEYEGEIFFNNKNICEFKPNYYRAMVNYLPQEPILFGQTPYDNFFMLKNLKIHKNLSFTDDKICRYLEELQLPKGILNKSIASLSGGEKQRIALVRSILINPKFILLDEPTSALDVFSEEVIFNFLKKLSENIGIVIVSHSKNIIMNSDIKILLMKNGYKIFESDFDENFIYQTIKEENEK